MTAAPPVGCFDAVTSPASAPRDQHSKIVQRCSPGSIRTQPTFIWKEYQISILKALGSLVRDPHSRRFQRRRLDRQRSLSLACPTIPARAAFVASAMCALLSRKPLLIVGEQACPGVLSTPKHGLFSHTEKRKRVIKDQSGNTPFGESDVAS